MTTRRARGTGSIRRRGNVWLIRYSIDGQQHEESSHSEKRSDAVKLLNKRLGEIQTGRYQGPTSERLTFSDLEAMLTDHYYGKRSKRRAEGAIKHLNRHLGLYRAKNITADVLTAYVKARREEEAAPATIRYELAILKNAFSLAVRAEKLDRRPAFPEITVENVRKGFFEDDEFRAVCEELPDYLRPLMTFAFLTGWRVRSELLGLDQGHQPLTWNQVDFDAGVIRLEPGTTKSGEGRTLPFDVVPELETLLNKQRAYTDKWERVRGEIIPLVFHREGKPIRKYYYAWHGACERAGYAGKIPHDFRRTAVRRLERAGVSRSVAKQLVGHQTDSIYNRYAIVTEEDLREGMKKIAKLQKQTGRRKVLPMKRRENLP